MTGYRVYPQKQDAPSIEYSVKKNRGPLQLNERVTAADILSGSEPELLNDVLTSMITVFCIMLEDSEYILIAPASAYSPSKDDGNDGKYVNCCVDNPLLSATAIPLSLYDETNTVLLADLTGDKGTFEVLDRNMLVTMPGDKVEDLNWIEWNISYNVMNVGNLLLQDENGSFNNAVSTTNISLNRSLMNAWSTGLVDNVFKSMSSMVITTSIVGSERNTFSKPLRNTINDDQNKGGNLGTKNNMVSDTTSKSNENNGEGGARIDGIQVTGILLFILVSGSVAFIINISSKGIQSDDARSNTTYMYTRAGIPYVITGDVLESDLSTAYDEVEPDNVGGTHRMSSESSMFRDSGCLV